jgi:outer membrane protein OmpA-like peptidoglycan-associated protein
MTHTIKPLRSALLMSALFFGLMAFGQKTKEPKALAKADKLYADFNYGEAIYYYEIALAKKPNDPQIFRKIGMCHRNLGQYEESAVWFERTLEKDQSQAPDMLYLAEALKSAERYPEAINWYREYSKRMPGDSRPQRHLGNDKYYQELKSMGNVFNIRRLDMNDEFPSFGMTKMEEGYLFASSGPPDKIGSRQKAVFVEQPYLDIYVGEKNENDEIINIRPIEGNINSKFNDGPATFDPSAGIIYVTRNNIQNGKPVRDKSGTVQLKIYSAEREKGVWTKIEELPFNSDDYSTAHPCVSYDGQWLYFASNRPGGFGGTDIYRVKRENGAWGKPENLGPEVNTEGDEMFPFAHSDGSLFFSSDGHAGLGGLDVFQTRQTASGWTTPENVGKPVNTPKDDFAMFYDYNTNVGYFSSNRGGPDSDDIYWFEDLRVRPVMLEGIALYERSKTPVAGAKVIVKRADGPQFGLTDEAGRFRFEVKQGESVSVGIVTPDKIENLADNLSVLSKPDLGIFYITEKPEEVVEAKPEPKEKEEAFVDEKGNEYTTISLLEDLKLNNIYFDYNSSAVRADAKETMKKVLQIMKENPDFRLQITAHADSRGSSDYNEKLSRLRAENAKQYLIKQGLSANRIVMNWYGKSQLEAECPPGQDCDELIHQLNRRAEFRIVKK